MRLTGKRIAVTGAAGGLAAAMVRRFATEGAELELVDQSSPALDALLGDLGAGSSGARATGHPTDVTDEAAVVATFGRIRASGPLDALVVTAGIQLHGEDGPAADISMDTWQRTMAVNLTGAFLCCREALPALRSRDTSSVVLVGSPTGLTMSGAGYTAYSASKAGMMSLARTIAADYAGDGVRANVLVPGTMVTPLTRQLMADAETRSRLVAGTPLGRLGRPDDLVGLAAWLVSDESEFATGATFAVDGGLTVR